MIDYFRFRHRIQRYTQPTVCLVRRPRALTRHVTQLWVLAVQSLHHLCRCRVTASTIPHPHCLSPCLTRCRATIRTRQAAATVTDR